jgi:hypothetical protein
LKSYRKKKMEPRVVAGIAGILWSIWKDGILACNQGKWLMIHAQNMILVSVLGLLVGK